MNYFISYDIANSKRLQRVAKILENFGIRIQYSFFECEMEKPVFEILRSRLLEEMDLAEDSLRIYPICNDCIKLTGCLGNGNIYVPKNFIIL